MDYHVRIMNLQPREDYAVDRHSCGFRDARHAAAQVALEAVREIERLRKIAYTPASQHDRRCDCAVCVPF
jgi:hypothetical protein